MTMLVIDGDSLLYKACYSTAYYKVEGVLYDTESRASQEAFKADREVSKRYVEPSVDEAIWRLRGSIGSILSNCKERVYNVEDNYKVYLSPTGLEYVANYKLGIQSIAPYKANRMLTPKPKHFKVLFKYILDNYNAEVAMGIEADDLCGIANGEGHVSAAIDKDVLYACPGVKYNYDTKEYFKQSNEDAWRYYFTQVLMGDTADNITGLYKVGPKRAAKVLEDVESSPTALYGAVLKEYINYFPGYHPKKVEFDILHNMCRLLWIHRVHGDSYRDYI